MFKPVPNSFSRNAAANVILKDGTEYFGKDLPEKPFGNEGFFSFWASEEALLVIPNDQIKRIFIYDNSSS